ncbi:single-stranded DNA-binding protein [Segniliparus rotundus]|uniref:single-stranded DNA-binding protein n=1 Tax=Segniliparus rotundus TaxID=286802 RepID=UPI000305FEB4|nr:single-stranded DNA-binding protein [Segniliparus rotundus]
MSKFASDYIDVAERLAMFFHAYPDGSLQPADLRESVRVVEVVPSTFLLYVALADRNPDDPRPGVWIPWEPYPGKTTFMRDSEAMNAETSAWGRAVMGAPTKRPVASAQEVAARCGDRAGRATEEFAQQLRGEESADAKEELRQVLEELGTDPREAVKKFRAAFGDDLKTTNDAVATGVRRCDTQARQLADGPNSYFRCAVWRELAPHGAQSLGKGDGVMLIGKIQSRSWGNQTGERRIDLAVKAEHVGPSLRASSWNPGPPSGSRRIAAHVCFDHRPEPPQQAPFSFDGCEKPARHGVLGLRPLRRWRPVKPRHCLVAVCGLPAYAKSLCEKHYNRERNDASERSRPRAQTIEEHFAAHVKLSGGYWIWTGESVPTLLIRAERTSVSARKWAFERVYGPIGRGRLSAACGEPLCVDPDHATLFRATAERRGREGG